MPAPFIQLTLSQFASLLERFTFGSRRINGVHLHHTWKPDHATYRGRDTIVNMARVHVEQNHWSDIAQHLSIGPNGELWTGRDWNRAPASASGFNGNAQVGPFMIEMIGNFDEGHDRLQGNQLEAVIEVIARLQERFKLAPDTLRFHRTMSTKTCPGTSVDYASLLEQVVARRATLDRAPVTRSLADDEVGPFGEEALKIGEFLEACNRARSTARDPDGAECPEESMTADEVARMVGETARLEVAPRAGRAASRGVADRLTPDVLNGLRPHVINLVQGRFTPGGLYSSTPGDVDAIFDQHLPAAMAEAKQQGKELQLMFYAHGGLVNEAGGLWMAHRLIPWWKKNNIYPIYFVWETGLGETLGQILLRGRRELARAVPRDLFDYTTDPLLERVARALRGELIWSGMKRSAERAAAPDGGSRYVAEKLKAFLDQQGASASQLHAVGHSAGSIFHAHFVPCALEVGIPSFKTMSFLAPAIRVDTFLSRLAEPFMKSKIEHLDIFTMTKDWEKADNCVGLYRKSLLYLIYAALEAEPKTPILGLEIALRENPDLRAMFGLAGIPNPRGEVVWSKTRETTGTRASRSASHGGFDNDPPTMCSVAARILGLSDTVGLAPFPADAAADRGILDWSSSIWPEDLEFLAQPEGSNGTGGGMRPTDRLSGGSGVLAGLGSPQPVGIADLGSGRKKALCVGINVYPSAPLNGCVKDAQDWEKGFREMGFDVDVLLDHEATHDAIIAGLDKLVEGSQAGDVLTFQYSGHGTQLPDENGDEREDQKDEALCPVDYESGAFVIDDELDQLFRKIPQGVLLTCFMDCCHSGTNTRLAIGRPAGGVTHTIKRRFMPATPQMIEAHEAYRLARGQGRSARATESSDVRRVVVFAACKSHESAYETDGQGDFTGYAVPRLGQSAGQLSNEGFQRDLIQAFGEAPRQHPEIDCSLSNRTLPLLSSAMAPSAAALTGDVPSGLPEAFRAGFGKREVARFTKKRMGTKA